MSACRWSLPSVPLWCSHACCRAAGAANLCCSGRVLTKAVIVTDPEEEEPEKPHKKNSDRVKQSERPPEGEFLFRGAFFTGGTGS